MRAAQPSRRLLRMASQSAATCRPQTALVTGGNRGIGLEVVKSLLEDPADHYVFFGCRDMQSGQTLAEKLRELHGQRVEAIQLDVTCADSISKAVDQISSSQRDLNILVNNAGILLDADDTPFDIVNVRKMMQVNFEGAVAVTNAFFPLLLRNSEGSQVLSTSSGQGTRTMGLLSESDRQMLLDPALDESQLRAVMKELVEGLQDADNKYHSIPQVGYGFSKLALNCITQVWSRKYPTVRVNACSPGFCNTDMCANYTGERKPKDPALGASVFKKAMFGELGQGRSGCFFKEASKTGTPLENGVACVDPWVA